MLRRVAPLVVAAMVSLLGCSGEASTSSSTSSSAPPSASGSTHPSTAAPAPEGTAGAAGILAFDAPSEVPCTAGSTALVSVTYRTTGLAGVALVVDGAAQASTDTTDPPPTSATDGMLGVQASAVVELPCDGNVHTVMLIGSGADGPAFASKAVVTRAA